MMNQKTLELLGYTSIIDEIKEFALSEIGRDLIGKIEPSHDRDRIKNQLAEVTEAIAILDTTSSVPLQKLTNIHTILEKLGKGIALNPEDLEAIMYLLKSVKRLRSFMAERESIAPTVSSYVYSMYELSDIASEIETCIHNGRVDDQASSHLEKVRKKILIAEGRIKSKLDSLVKSSTIKKCLQDTFVSLKNNRYVLSVKSEYRHQIQGTIIQKSSSGSTLFIEPAAVGKLQGELESLKIDEEKEIYQILMYLTAFVEENIKEIERNVEVFSYYDFLFAKAKYSKSIGGNEAAINYDGFTKIIKGRHPMLGDNSIPLDFEIGKDYRSLVITGPNTGGKTVVLKTVGLFTAMIQSGLHVPVEKGSHFAIYSDILADIGDGQSIEQSLSTFSAHITNIISILKVASPYTLVLLDELGAGTDPMEGEGLAVAVLEELYEKKSTIVATSHYAKVKDYAAKREGFKNGRMAFDIATLKPKYVLEIGSAGESNAFIIAMKLGMHSKIIERAHLSTYKEEKDYSHLVPSTKGIPDAQIYKKQRKPKAMTRAVNREKKSWQDQHYEIGDVVFIHTLKERGIVCEVENEQGEIGVKIKSKKGVKEAQDKKNKIIIHKKRVSPFLSKEQLYPENYDTDIVLKSKDYRKKNNTLSRKYSKDIILEEE